jgi:uncharacterized membrane protein YraQ (UPF0718 family)
MTEPLVITDTPELSASPSSPRTFLWGTVIFVTIAVAGLYYVKWGPYFHRAFVAAAQHSIGVSIISGKAAAPPAVGWQAAWSYTTAYFKAIWQAMVLGLLVGSAAQALLPRDGLARVFGASGFRSTAVAGGASISSMMCTCCAAPIAVSLRSSRASVGATLAYWLGNPMLNPATMIFTGFVLGWHWVGLRLAAGAALAFGVAHLVGRVQPVPGPPVPAASGGAAEEGATSISLMRRWGKALWQLSVGLIPEYIVIVAALGAVRTWLFPAVNPAIGHSLWLMILLAIAGTLFVIPTAGEIPIVQTLMSFGLGAGGAGVLLITLPPVSLPSLVMVGRVVPARALALVVLSVVVLGLLTGGAAQLLGF